VAGRERDLERFLTFIDAVVAIAITLLVLPLAEAGSEINQDETVAEVLREHVVDIFGFLLSFAVISRLWLAQHAIVSGLARQTPAVVNLLLAWTLTIVFLPFPTTLVAATDNGGLVKVLYIGTMAVSSALLTWLSWLIARDRSLRDTDVAPHTVEIAATTVTFLVALAASLIFPASGFLPLLLLVLAEPIANRLKRRRAAAPVSR
jgi:uncharacterized membrane protein